MNVESQSLVTEIVIVAVGVLWALIKSSEWYKQAQKDKYAKIVSILSDSIDAAVEKVYNTAVLPVKQEAASNGQELVLSPEYRQELRDMAYSIASDLLSAKGIDIKSIADKETIEAKISMAVNSRKR